MKKGLLKKLIAIVAVATIAIGMVGCGSSKAEGSNENKSTVESIKSKGKLVVGTSGDYPPYEFHKMIDGKDEIVGFDIELAKQFASDLGVELEIRDMDFDGLLVALQANKVDMVFAGMTPTKERRENADFSDIYYTATHRFIVRSGDETSINSMDDLKGKKIGVQKGSIQEGIAKDNFDAENIKALAKVPDLVLDLKNNKVDAVLVEKAPAEINAEKNDGIVVVEQLEVKDPDGGTAIAVKKNSPELLEEINKTVNKLKEENKIEQFMVDANKMLEE